MDESLTVILKTDQVLGLYACVDEVQSEGLREYLIESGQRFGLDPEQAARLAKPGLRTFVFGSEPADRILDVIEDYGLEVEVDAGEVVTETSYRPPVDQLLTLGKSSQHAAKVDYARLGIGREHVPELIRMATDDELNSGPSGSSIVWAPVHAWWALAELRAEQAIVPLLGLLRRVDEEDDDWVGEEVPRVLAAIGPAAISPLADYLANTAHGEWARVNAAKALGMVGQQHVETRAECVACLTAQLEHFAEQSENLNALLMSPLLDLKAVEAAPSMARAFASGRVDEMVNGDWEDLQIELGLTTQREHPRKPNKLTELGDKLRAAWTGTGAGLPLPDKDGNFPEPPAPPDPPPLPPVERVIAAATDGKPYIADAKVGRNAPCPCGSGKKFKKCCGR